MTIVELQDDLYPFGCKGDVVGLTDEQLKALDDEAKKRKVRNVYNVINPVAEAGETESKKDEDKAPKK